MPKDPICGMEVLEPSPFHAEREGQHYFFCSESCRKKFIFSETKRSPIPFPRTAIGLVLFASIFFLSGVFPAFHRLHHGVLDYLRVIWWAIGFGFFLGGLIDYYIPKEYISYLLAGSSKRTILRATVLGFLLSACSHGILALSMALYKKGASTASVVSFLLASPWANMAVTFLLVGLFGIKGWLFILSAMVVALITGLLFQELSRRNWVEHNPNTVQGMNQFSLWGDFKKRIQSKRWTLDEMRKDAGGILKGVGALSEMVLPWVLLGVVLAGSASAFIPQTFFHRFFGPTLLGLFTTLVAATVIETCSEGSAPLAFGLYRSTGAFGNSFVFLMAGVITDYTEISLLWANIGKRTALWMIALTVPQVLLLGFIFNLIF